MEKMEHLDQFVYKDNLTIRMFERVLGTINDKNEMYNKGFAIEE